MATVTSRRVCNVRADFVFRCVNLGTDRMNEV
jgi:hypothetical protein